MTCGDEGQPVQARHGRRPQQVKIYGRDPLGHERNGQTWNDRAKTIRVSCGAMSLAERQQRAKTS
jgi:hypothetical protein